MTDDPEQTLYTDNAETAMNDVLAAEQAAAKAIDACEQDARASLRKAVQRARRIAARTDKRIALIHLRTRQQLQQRLHEAERAERLAEQARNSDDPRMSAVESVVSKLAALLTGGGDQTLPD